MYSLLDAVIQASKGRSSFDRLKNRVINIFSSIMLDPRSKSGLMDHLNPELAARADEEFDRVLSYLQDDPAVYEKPSFMTIISNIIAATGSSINSFPTVELYNINLDTMEASLNRRLVFDLGPNVQTLKIFLIGSSYFEGSLVSEGGNGIAEVTRYVNYLHSRGLEPYNWTEAGTGRYILREYEAAEALLAMSSEVHDAAETLLSLAI